MADTDNTTTNTTTVNEDTTPEPVIDLPKDTSATETPSPEDLLSAELAQTRTERDTFQDRMLRIAADYENFRRRIEREKEDIRQFGTEQVIRDMIPVLDNLDRALAHCPPDDNSSLVEGVRMVQRQFRQALARQGVSSFDCLGLPFDPLRHEALHQIESNDHPNNTVLEEFQKGYLLHERLLRPAMVVVSKTSAKES